MFSFYLIFSHLVIEKRNFTCAFFYFHIFSNNLLICLLFKSSKIVDLNFMKSTCCIYSYVLNYSFLFYIFDGYWGLKPMVSLRLVYYCFSADCQDWFGLAEYNILLKQGVLNNIWPKLTNVFQIFSSFSLRTFSRH